MYNKHGFSRLVQADISSVIARFIFDLTKLRSFL